ncbi:MAG: hypothetical protein R8P61_33260 [Bacteroidia bacterium]|nr:hypothetical protein [Bacteroidia bacterium]
MNGKFIFLNITALLFFFYSACSESSSDLEDFVPHVFEAGKVSGPLIDYALDISFDGKELFFARSDGAWGRGPVVSSIYWSNKMGTNWTDPEMLSFSAQEDDGEPYLSRGGDSLFFTSKRPWAEQEVSQDIWMIVRDEEGNWGEARPLPIGINSPAREYSPKINSDGDFYFISDREGGLGQGDIYVIPDFLQGGDSVINLGARINSEKGEWNLGFDESGDVMIFEASERAENKSPYGDLYISFRKEGIWSFPQNMQELNSSGSDLSPEFSSKYLYYSSSDSLASTTTQIYRVKNTRLLTRYRESAKW